MSSLVYVFAAYTVAWVVILGYLFLLARRQQELRWEIEALRRALEEPKPSEVSRPSREPTEV